MKTLITHINPHLDDIAAIWLFKKFQPDFSDAKVEFVSASKGNLPADESPDQVYLGVGRGKYDEHKGDVEDCAASLVWKDLKIGSYLDEFQIGAMDELVDWVRLDDTGKLKTIPYPEFYVSGFIRVGGGEADSRNNLEFGIEILERIFKILTSKQKAKKEWQGAESFQTKFGKTYVVEGTYVNRTFCDTQDGDLYLMIDPKHKSVQFYTPIDGNDLEPIYQQVTKLDPNGSWFLHQSHKMVICGSASAPESTPTKLSLEELRAVLKAS